MFQLEDIAEELAMLQNEPSVWDAWCEAMENHPDWDPSAPEEALAIIQNILPGWRLR